MVGSDQFRETPSLLKTLVSALTSGINVATGATVDEQRLVSSSSTKSLSPSALKAKIQRDYSKAYFVTGDISPDAYDAHCVFTG